MEVGKRNVIEAVKLLAKIQCRYVDLITANRTVRGVQVIVDGTETYALKAGREAWVMIPTIDIIGISVELEDYPENVEPNLPALLKHLRQARTPLAA